VAYGSLLQERRRGLHARIVDAIERLAPDRLADHVEQLAHHAVRGEVWDKACLYCRQAGAKATARFALREAVAAFEQALGALQHLPDHPDTRAQAIDLCFDLRTVLQPLGAHGRILAHLRQAAPLAEALGDARRRVYLVSYMSSCLRQLGDVDEALASAQHALAIATTAGDRDLQITARHFLSQDYQHHLSDYRRATEVFRQNVEALHGVPRQERFGTAVVLAVHAPACLAMCLGELGAFAEGRVHGAHALQLAETVDHPYTMAQVSINVGELYLRQGALLQAIGVLERGLALCEAVPLPGPLRVCSWRLGAAYALAGRVPEALSLLERARELSVATGRTFRHPLVDVWVGESYVLAGRLTEAYQFGQRALQTAQAWKARGFQAYALRLLGEMALSSHPPDVTQAEIYYRQAFALADELGMRPLLAHCQRSLGTLYATTGQREQARTELSTAIALYRAMDMTFWLPQAEAALAQVGGG